MPLGPKYEGAERETLLANKLDATAGQLETTKGHLHPKTQQNMQFF